MIKLVRRAKMRAQLFLFRACVVAFRKRSGSTVIDGASQHEPNNAALQKMQQTKAEQSCFPLVCRVSWAHNLRNGGEEPWLLRKRARRNPVKRNRLTRSGWKTWLVLQVLHPEIKFPARWPNSYSISKLPPFRSTDSTTFKKNIYFATQKNFPTPNSARSGVANCRGCSASRR